MPGPDLTELERIAKVEEAARDRLLAIPGVHGIGIGYKYKNGEYTNELAIIITLLKKRSINEVPTEELIPAEIEGVKTDVREGVFPEYCDDAGRYRPLRSGSKLQYTRKTVTHPAPGVTVTDEKFLTGTLGFMAKARRTGKFVAVTNAHVVSGCELPDTAIGRRIGQPDDNSDCSCCSKCWATVIGTVIAAKKDPGNPNVDVALIELDKCVDTSPQVQGGLGPIHGTLTTAELNSLLNATVSVRGYRTGEVRQGIVRQVHHSGGVNCEPFDGGPLIPHNFVDVLRIENPPGATDRFSQRGDSGSVVLTADGKIVGLLFGQANSTIPLSAYYVCRVDNILSVFQTDYDLQVVTNPEFGHEETITPVAPFSFSPTSDNATDTFEPDPEDLRLLEQARDEVLATPMGQHIMQLVSHHVTEIRELVRTKPRVTALWRRLAAPDLLRAAVAALRSPESSAAKFVKGTPLEERVTPLLTVITQYGSDELIADLDRFLPLARQLSDVSYLELCVWLKTTSIDQI